MPGARSELSQALSACRNGFAGVALFSGVINLLYLTGSFFMLEIYDRVLPSRSIPTLVGLGVLALILYAFQGILDLIRGRVLVRIGASLDQDLSSRVYDVLVRLPLKTRAADGLQPLRDLDQVRALGADLQQKREARLRYPDGERNTPRNDRRVALLARIYFRGIMR